MDSDVEELGLSLLDADDTFPGPRPAAPVTLPAVPARGPPRAAPLPPAPAPIPAAVPAAPAPAAFPAPPAPRPAAHPAAPRAQPAPALGPAPSGAQGLFRAQHETDKDEFAHIRRRTQAELQAITESGMAHVFCPLRVAETTRPRSDKDDAITIAALKVQKNLQAVGLSAGSMARETHHLCYGPQATFTSGLNPHQIGELLPVAIPFMINSPNDITSSAAWQDIRKLAITYNTRLEAEIRTCRAHGTEYAMANTIFRLVKKLMLWFLTLRARAMLPLMNTDPLAPYAADILAIAGGYIDQAVMMPECLDKAEDMIDNGIFSANALNPEMVDNAARAAMARPFLQAIIHGSERPKHTAVMIEKYLAFTAGPVGATGPAGPVGPAPGQRPAPPPKPTPAPAPRAMALMSPGQDRGSPAGAHGQLFDIPGRPGLRMDPAGFIFHPQWYSGEYSTPPGWVPPPGAAGLPIPKPPPGSNLNIPVALAIVTTSSPFTTSTRDPCRYCSQPGHAQYECPKRFAETFYEPLPGFLASGLPDPAAWLHGTLLAPARSAMADYLRRHNVQAHRKYAVTADCIASGLPPSFQP